MDTRLQKTSESGSAMGETVYTMVSVTERPEDRTHCKAALRDIDATALVDEWLHNEEGVPKL